MLYAICFEALLRWQARVAPGPLAAARATALSLAGPALLLTALARLGFTGGSTAGFWVLFAFAGAALVLRMRGVRPGLPFVVIALGLAAAIACPRPDIGPGSVARDGLAHLAWSKDLASASAFYVPGFPAFVSTLTAGNALIGAFRVAPALLLAALFLTVVALGSSRGWVLAGLAGCAAMVSMPAMAARLAPALPEVMAYPLIVASWLEVDALRGGRRDAHVWLGLLSLALVVVHVSILEMAHFLAMGLTILAMGERSWAGRVRILAALAAGLAAAFAVAPVLGEMVFGEGILLVHGQPSELGPFSVRAFGAGLGLFMDVSLVALCAGLVLAGRRAWALAAPALPFAGAALLLVSPMLLKSVGIDFPLQVFDSRLYAAASLFVALGWVVLLTGLRGCRPGLAAAVAVLPVAGIALRFLDAPWFVVPPGIAALAAWVAARVGRRSGAWRAGSLLALLALVVAVRLVVWIPTDPAWVRTLRGIDPAGRVLLTHWPAFNAVQARTDLPVELGIGGADAQLPLHAISAMPVLRSRLRWSADSAAADREALRHWVQDRPEEEILVLVHRDLAAAWSGYASVFSRRVEAGLGTGDLVYRADPVLDAAPERLQRIDAALRALGPVQIVYEDPEATLYRVRPRDLRASGTPPG